MTRNVSAGSSLGIAFCGTGLIVNGEVLAPELLQQSRSPKKTRSCFC
jgi:hypothetical protein